LDEERAHALALQALHYTPKCLYQEPAGQAVHALGLVFPHPVGLAAGLDKNGEHIDALAKLGFSFIEIGTVTPRAQIGNPKPRLFRLPEAQAIINRMGFNNHGVEALVENVKKSRYKGIVGINIGKNKDTDLNKAIDDYSYCFERVYPYASYVTINISSPNTPDLRQLQQKEYLSGLLTSLQEQQAKLAEKHERHVPLVVKISPDETDEVLKEMTEVILQSSIEGIIATNTTSARDAVKHLQHGQEQGGLSGPPVFAESTRCLRLLKEYVGEALTLIGVGGIDSAKAAEEKLKQGATLVQVYTGLIYQGPNLIRDIVSGVAQTSIRN
jgi:dihydroorotate dehydrogenase